jgi:hypothetical protein
MGPGEHPMYPPVTSRITKTVIGNLKEIGAAFHPAMCFAKNPPASPNSSPKIPESVHGFVFRAA